jgi:hypothetical protein
MAGHDDWVFRTTQKQDAKVSNEQSKDSAEKKALVMKLNTSQCPYAF